MTDIAFQSFLCIGSADYRALWNHIMDVSVSDMKRNYERLNVHFELWNGESTVQDIIPGMVQDMKDKIKHKDQ